MKYFTDKNKSFLSANANTTSRLTKSDKKHLIRGMFMTLFITKFINKRGRKMEEESQMRMENKLLLVFFC